MIYLLITNLLLSQPGQIVIGLDYPDIRHAQYDNALQVLKKQVNGVEILRLSRSLVLWVPDQEGTEQHLKSLPKLRYIKSDPWITIRFKQASNDPLYPEQWNLHSHSLAHPDTFIQVEPAWATMSNLLSFATIAVLDDGFDLNHPDLMDNLGELGLDVSQDPNDDDPSYEGQDWHGTKTLGVIAAVQNNAIGLSGICPWCSILPIRLVANGGSQEVYTRGSLAAYALEWAVDHGAAVINNSWGPPDGNRFDPMHKVMHWPLPEVVSDAFNYALRNGRNGLGAVIIWAAGNGAELITYDGFASDPRVVAVGSISSRGVISAYSDWGPPIKLVAPSSGSNDLPGICTSDISGIEGESQNDYLCTFGGTSAAAATAAGVAGLVISAFPKLTAAQVIESLISSAFKIDPDRANYTQGHSLLYGYGRVDAFAALKWAATYENDSTFWFELCGNNFDDNNDGQVDEIEQCQVCVPNQPSELCDGIDNNCDGLVDENFVCQKKDRPICAPCTSSEQCQDPLACQEAEDFPGKWCFSPCEHDNTCSHEFYCHQNFCVLESPSNHLNCLDYLRCQQPESCDGRDNNCNGIIDDIDINSKEVETSLHKCGYLGVCEDVEVFCIDGHWQCQWPLVYESKETICDKLDNDCDGIIDEDCFNNKATQTKKGCGFGCQLFDFNWFFGFGLFISWLLLRTRRS